MADMNAAIRVMKVELNAWECERLVLAMIQMAHQIPRPDALYMMKHLQEAEFDLIHKIDEAGKSIMESVKSNG